MIGAMLALVLGDATVAVAPPPDPMTAPAGPPTNLTAHVYGGVYRIFFATGDAAAYTRAYHTSVIVATANPGVTFVDVPYGILLGNTETFTLKHYSGGQESTGASLAIHDCSGTHV